jgi:hypothetical protein
MNPEKFLEIKNKEADEINSKRKFTDKILGRNKVSGMDLVREEAEKENIRFDAVKNERERVAAEEKNRKIASMAERFDVKPVKPSKPAEPNTSVKRQDKIPELKFKCQLCGQDFSGKHLCNSLKQKGYSAPVAPSEDTSSFFTSYIVGQYTDDPLLGYLAGRNIAGALLGASSHSRSSHNAGIVSGEGGEYNGGGAQGSWPDNKSEEVGAPEETVEPVTADNVQPSDVQQVHEFEAPTNKY